MKCLTQVNPESYNLPYALNALVLNCTIFQLHHSPIPQISSFSYWGVGIFGLTPHSIHHVGDAPTLTIHSTSFLYHRTFQSLSYANVHRTVAYMNYFPDELCSRHISLLPILKRDDTLRNNAILYLSIYLFIYHTYTHSQTQEFPSPADSFFRCFVLLFLFLPPLSFLDAQI